MALRNTSWITGAHAIIESEEFSHAGRFVSQVDGTIYTRTLNRRRRVWVCLTYDAAKNYADMHAGDTNVQYTVQEDNRIIGSYKLVEDLDSVGAWEEVEE